MTKSIYVAGPMRRQPEFNFPAFDAAANRLRIQGHEVFNPAERDRIKGFDERGLTGFEPLHELENFDHREAVAEDMAFITIHADAVYMLIGWQFSKGAVAERALAQALGLELLYECNEDESVIPVEELRRDLPA